MTVAISILVHISLALSIVMVIIVARKYQDSQIRSAFQFALSAIVIWNAGTMLEADFYLVRGITYNVFIEISYIGICLTPVAILYLGKAILSPGWSPRKIHMLFLVVPVISIVMVFTNPMHYLFFENFSMYSSELAYGPYFTFHAAYSYGCIAAGIILMIAAAVRSSGIFSKQSLFVILGIIVAVIPNILFSFGILDLHFSINSVFLTATLLFFMIAFMKYRFIASLPISLRQVVDMISDGYLVIDKQYCILDYNKSLLRMFQSAGKASISTGMNIQPLIENYFIDGSFDRFTRLQRRAMSLQRTLAVEKYTVDNICVSIEITPVMQLKNHIGSIILIKDITKSKIKIENTKAASQAKSDFLSHMSHEIRSPLNAILGMINIGMNTDDIEKKDYCLKRADSASKHLLGVINDILDMSKIEADKLELSYGEIDFGKMLRGIADVANVKAEEKKLKFSVNLNENVPAYIEGDELRLAQVITNLLSNAIKFTPEAGSVDLTIEKIEDNGENSTIRFEVKDTGIGISEEQQAQLFSSYSQANAGITKKFGGTGLGLAISKRIVDMMGGRIWIESKLGEGAKFIFTMKAKNLAEKSRAAAESLRQEADEEGSRLRRTHDFQNYTLLVVEDIEINREIIGAILEETKISIDYAENGEVAVSMFKESPAKYNAVLMDLDMPVMNGYEATRQIRALDTEYSNNIPILAMTANVFKEDIEKCLESGMNDHTGKPIDSDALFGMLNKYLTMPGKTVKMKNVHKLEYGIAWDENLLTGNVKVDMQHQKIFEKISEIVRNCETVGTRDQLYDTLEFMVNLTVRHFADEEALQLEYKYPFIDEHKEQHERFKIKVGGLVLRFRENGSSASLNDDVNKIIVRWLVHHIRVDDKKFSEYIRYSSINRDAAV